MTRPIAEGETIEWAVYRCPNGCREPDDSQPVEERAPVFKEGGDEAERWTDVQPFTCSVCGSQLTKTGTAPAIDNSRKF